MAPPFGSCRALSGQDRNGRLSFCQSWLLEMQNMIPIQPLHLPLQSPTPLPALTSLLWSCITKQPYLSTRHSLRKFAPDPVTRAKSERALCQSAATPCSLCFSIKHADETWSRPSPGTLQKSQGSQLSQSQPSVCHPDCSELSLTPNKASTALLLCGFQRFN